MPISPSGAPDQTPVLYRMSDDTNPLDEVVDLLLDYLSPLQEAAENGDIEILLASRSWVVADIDIGAIQTAVAAVYRRSVGCQHRYR